MKWLARSFVFVLSALTGLVAASVVTPGGLSDCVVQFETADVETAYSLAPSGIRVMYSGWEYENPDVQPVLKFVIHNGLTVPIEYTAYDPEGPLPLIYANEKLISRDGWECGVGLRQFRILPGGSAEVREYPSDLLRRPGKKETVTVGFYLGPVLERYEDLYTSEPFQLPTEFREAIKR